MFSETQKQNKITLRAKKQNFKQKISYACTNAIYNLGIIGGLKRIPNLLCKDQSQKQIVILGEHFHLEQKKKAQNKFKKIIWFTYRKNIKITDDLNSDVGWGCLLRVGQMVLAEALTKFLVFSGINFDIELQRKIIEPFIDHPLCQSQYSLSSILKYARWRYEKNPGQWFYISQICNVLRKVHQKSPLAGTDKLNIIHFGQATIFVQEILQNAGFQNPSEIEQILSENLMQYNYQINNQNKNTIQYEFIVNNQDKENSQKVIQRLKIQKVNSFCCAKKQKSNNHQIKQKILVENNQNMNDYLQKQQNYMEKLNFQFKNHVLIMISAQVGYKNISSSHFKSILNLLSLKSSLGIIGGVPKKALYIIGFDKNQLIYLDPHYVQEYQQGAEQKQLNSYFCQNYRTLNYEALDSSMAFCFYLKNTDQLFQLTHKIKQQWAFSKQRGEDFFLSVLQKNQSEMQKGQRLKDKNSFEHNSLEFVDIMQCMNSYRK